MSTKQPIKEHIAEYNFARARAQIYQGTPRRQSAYPDDQLPRTRPPARRDTTDDEDAIYTTRAPNSIRRYPPGPAYVEVHNQRSRTQSQRAITPPRTQGSVHPLLFTAAGMLLMLAVWLAFG